MNSVENFLLEKDIGHSLFEGHLMKYTIIRDTVKLNRIRYLTFSFKIVNVSNRNGAKYPVP